MNYHRESSIKALEGFFKISGFFGLFPSYDFQNQTFKDVPRSRTYSLVLSMVMVVLNSISVVARGPEFWIFSNGALSLLDTLRQFSLTLTNSLAILSVNFFKIKELEQFLALLISVDERLEKYPKKSYEGKWTMFLELLINHMFCLFSTFHDYYFWLTLTDFQETLPFLFEYFQNYHVNILVLLIFNLVVSLKYRFQRLGGILSSLGQMIMRKKDLSNGDVTMKKVDLKNCFGELENLREIFNDLSDLVEIFNGIFGWILVWITNVIILGLLLNIEGYMLQQIELQNQIHYIFVLSMAMLYVLVRRLFYFVIFTFLTCSNSSLVVFLYF